MLKKYPNFKKFNEGFQVTEKELDIFIEKGKDEGAITKDNITSLNIPFVEIQLKALVARNLYETGTYFEVLAPTDHEINKALELIKEETTYESFGLSQ